jgi:hypothetical protein
MLGCLHTHFDHNDAGGGCSVVGDTSRNGSLCTFAESRSNVLNCLAGQRHRIALCPRTVHSVLVSADCKRLDRTDFALAYVPFRFVRCPLISLAGCSMTGRRRLPFTIAAAVIQASIPVRTQIGTDQCASPLLVSSMSLARSRSSSARNSSSEGSTSLYLLAKSCSFSCSTE